MKWPRLFEIEDQRWLPRILRDQLTDALRFLIVEMQIYAPIIPEFLWVMQQSRYKQVVDLCSGGTGPWEYLIGEITDPEEVVERVTLTDLYPNEQALRTLAARHPLFDYRSAAVDALNIDANLVGVRTLFSSFHHFNPRQAQSILQDAVNKQMPICIFEFTGRRLANFFQTPLAVVLLFGKLLFKQPLTPLRLLFSYLLPIVPLIFLWDSCVSHLRSYSQQELTDFVNSLSNSEVYEWEIGESRSPKTPFKNTYLFGYIKR